MKAKLKVPRHWSKKKMLQQLSSLKKTKKFAQNSSVVRVYHPKSSKKRTQILVSFWKLDLA
jgi:hypothetical protein